MSGSEEQKKEWEMISDSVIELSEKFDSMQEEVKELKIKLKAFFSVYLSKLSNEEASAFFKEYQKQSFKQ